jgi:hypothetical protein
MNEHLIVLTRGSELLHWLLPKAERFPRLYRSTLTQRLMDAALDFVEQVTDALFHSGSTRERHLRQADAALLRLRLYLRLAYRWHWLNDGQYRHVSRQVRELGRLLGGLRKAQRAAAPKKGGASGP